MIAKIILLFLMVLGLGMNIATHGKERKPNNAYISFISFIITITLLYYAGFFNN